MLSFLTRSLTRTSPGRGPRRPAFRLLLEPLEDRLVPSIYTVKDTASYPYSAAVQLLIDFQGHPVSCSGALIDGTHVLTAAHVLYSQTYGIADSVTVYPGRNGTNVEPFGLAHGVSWVVHSSYVSGPYKGLSDYDLGLVTIDRDLSNNTGYLGVNATYSDAYFNNGGSLFTLEYPGDTHNGVTQYVATGPALSADTNQVYWLLSDIPVEHGSSGAPVYVKTNDGSRYIVAVVSELSPTEGIGTRITSSKLEWIVSQLNGTPDKAPAPPPTGPSTPGVFDPASAAWYLRNSAAPGGPDAGSFAYGGPGWMPVAGDWKGDGVTTVGVVSPNATWYLRDTNSSGAPDVAPFAYGVGNWIPMVGDWDGNGTTTIGMFDPKTATWYLRNSNSPGAPDIKPFQYGAPGWIPVVGDWTGQGQTTIGVVDPKTMTWYLRNENSPGTPDILPFQYGAPGWIPVVGDWDGNGTTTVGVVDPKAETWYLRNENDPGGPDYAPFAYGAPGWLPISGNWRGIASGLPTPITQLALDRSATDAALYAIATANPAIQGNTLVLPTSSVGTGLHVSDQPEGSDGPQGNRVAMPSVREGTGDALASAEIWTPFLTQPLAP